MKRAIIIFTILFLATMLIPFISVFRENEAQEKTEQTVMPFQATQLQKQEPSPFLNNA